MSEAMQLLLEEQGVEVVNAETVLHRYPATIAGAWPLKPYAIAHSRFREVIFLDADTVPLADPGGHFRLGISIASRDWCSGRISSISAKAIRSGRRLGSSRDSASVSIRACSPSTRRAAGLSSICHPAQRALARRLQIPAWRQGHIPACRDPDRLSPCRQSSTAVHGRRRPHPARSGRRSAGASPNGSKWKLFGENRPVDRARACAALRAGHSRASPSLERRHFPSRPSARSERGRRRRS